MLKVETLKCEHFNEIYISEESLKSPNFQVLALYATMMRTAGSLESDIRIVLSFFEHRMAFIAMLKSKMQEKLPQKTTAILEEVLVPAELPKLKGSYRILYL